MTSKELRGRLRRALDVLTVNHDPTIVTEVVVRAAAILDALDAEEAKRRAPQIVGMATDSLEIYGPTPVYERPPEDDPAPESGP